MHFSLFFQSLNFFEQLFISILLAHNLPRQLPIRIRETPDLLVHGLNLGIFALELSEVLLVEFALHVVLFLILNQPLVLLPNLNAIQCVLQPEHLHFQLLVVFL